MVDHLAGPGLADGVRERGRTWYSKVGLEAIHGGHLSAYWDVEE
jgi:hypothetical protein